MWDPALPGTRGNMWESSPRAEATVPVAPSVCLKLTPDTSGFAIARADRELVAEINVGRMAGQREHVRYEWAGHSECPQGSRQSGRCPASGSAVDPQPGAPNRSTT
jgi:hypothetical protein